jgi:hypothetical protein
MRPVWLSTVRRTRAIEQDPNSLIAERVLAAALDGPTGCLTYAAIRGELQRETGRCVDHGGALIDHNPQFYITSRLPSQTKSEALT